jgi:ABC-type transport system involved in Fe-S cluster assembly fused permease/ATPase subunit
MNTTKVQLREPMNFIGVPYRSMREGLLTEAEMTQRQLHQQSSPLHG